MSPSSLHSAPVRERPSPVLGLGALFAVLVAVSLWTTLVGVVAQELTFLVDGGFAKFHLIVGLTSVGGLALGAVAYARRHDLDLGVGLPAAGTWPVAIALALSPVLLVGVVAGVGNLVGVPLSVGVQRGVNPDALWAILATNVPLAVFFGLGYGVLFCGVVYERVRDLVGSGEAFAVAAALSGFFWVLPIDAIGALRLSVGSVVEIVLSLTFGVAFGMALGVVHRHADAETGLSHREMAVLAVATVGVIGVGTGLTSIPRVFDALLWVTTFAIATLGYERTRSVWVPVAAITLFNVAITALVYAEAALGLV